jgi:hypothetical protein
MSTANTEIPIVETLADVTRLAGQTVYVEGVYEQEDVRMMQVNPPTSFVGHVVVVLQDGSRVFVYPPADAKARRSKQEIKRFEHRRVRALGVILARIPQEGAVQQAPCLIDVESIALAESPR